MDNYKIRVIVVNDKSLTKLKPVLFERIMDGNSANLDYQSIVNGLLAMFPAGHRVTIEISKL